MATSKTLAPTNVTISIPAMTDAPNASVLSNCIDKEADAINTLNSKLNGKANYYEIAANTDLNTLAANGLYRSPLTTADVGTLSNCPVSVPFTLIQTGNTSSYTARVQTIFIDGVIYTRRATSTGYGSWYKFTGSVVT